MEIKGIPHFIRLGDSPIPPFLQKNLRYYACMLTFGVIVVGVAGAILSAIGTALTPGENSDDSDLTTI